MGKIKDLLEASKRIKKKKAKAKSNKLDKMRKQAQEKLPSKYTESPTVVDMILDQIQVMVGEIERSEAGQRINIEDPKDFKKRIITKNKSTFPNYLQDIFRGSGTAKKFIAAANSTRSQFWLPIASEAIRRLEKGYQNHHGYDLPNQDFIDIVNMKDSDVPF